MFPLQITKCDYFARETTTPNFQMAHIYQPLIYIHVFCNIFIIALLKLTICIAFYSQGYVCFNCWCELRLNKNTVLFIKWLWKLGVFYMHIHLSSAAGFLPPLPASLPPFASFFGGIFV